MRRRLGFELKRIAAAMEKQSRPDPALYNVIGCVLGAAKTCMVDKQHICCSLKRRLIAAGLIYPVQAQR